MAPRNRSAVTRTVSGRQHVLAAIRLMQSAYLKLDLEQIATQDGEWPLMDEDELDDLAEEWNCGPADPRRDMINEIAFDMVVTGEHGATPVEESLAAIRSNLESRTDEELQALMAERGLNDEDDE